MSRRLAMGELEATVMDVLWDAGGWRSPGDVHGQLESEVPRRLAYTTVMTVLVRLWKKGRLERRREGRAYLYRPIYTRDEHAARRMQELLVEAGDRPAALANFVGQLPAEDREQLRKLLADRGAVADRAGNAEHRGDAGRTADAAPDADVGPAQDGGRGVSGPGPLTAGRDRSAGDRS